MSESLDEQGAVAGVNPAAPASGETASVVEPVVAAEPLPSAGALLREAREAAGVDLLTLAQALKVSVKKIEALETDAYDRLPDPVFTRGLASSVCRALKVDARPILDRMPTSPTVRLAQEEGGLNTPFQTPGDVIKTPFLDQLSRPMILTALVILLGAIVLVFFPSAERRSEIGAIVNTASSNAARSEATAPSTSGSDAAAPASERAEVVPTPAVTSSQVVLHKLESASSSNAARSSTQSTKAATAAVSTPAAVSTSASSSVAVTPTRTAAPSITTSAPTPAVPAPAPVAATKTVVANEVSATSDAPRKKLPGTGTVVFKTTGSSWVNVTDAQGSVLLSREVLPDEPVGVNGGKMPLSISIGRADLTTVTVRGQPYDLAPVTRQGVARFELK